MSSSQDPRHPGSPHPTTSNETRTSVLPSADSVTQPAPEVQPVTRLDPKVDAPNPHAVKTSFSAPMKVSSAVNNHRAISATLPRMPVRYSSMNFFIPCFGMMYSILAAMNDKVCSLRAFSDNGPANDWIPQCSVIVYSILAIVQVLRAQSLLRMISDEQSLFLARFLDQFPLSNIEIPGPLVPFFRSLSIAQPGFGDFELVGPALPSLSYSEERLYAMDYTIPGTNNRFTGIDMMLPHIPLMLDQFRQLLTFLLSNDVRGNLNRYSAWTQFSEIFGMASPAAGSARLPIYSRLLRSLGFTSRPTTSDGHMARFAQFYSGAVSQFPPAWTFSEAHAPVAAQPRADPPVVAREANWTTYEDLFTCMGFDVPTAWFHTLIRGLPTFTQHFKGNVRLSDISPTSSTAAMVIFKNALYSALPHQALFNRTLLNKASYQMVFNTYGSTSCPTIPREDFEDAQMAQVNITCDQDFGNGHRIGAQDVTHFGDFWRVPPVIYRTNRGDLTLQYMSIVVSPDFFQEKS